MASYLEEQATRGKDEYEYNCGNCHIHDLSGDSIKDVPPLAGSDFLAKWQGKSVKELLDYTTTTMPQDSRGSLGAKTYADITAYILKVNMFPAGTQPLEDWPASRDDHDRAREEVVLDRREFVWRVSAAAMAVPASAAGPFGRARGAGRDSVRVRHLARLDRGGIPGRHRHDAWAICRSRRRPGRIPASCCCTTSPG